MTVTSPWVLLALPPLLLLLGASLRVRSRRAYRLRNYLSARVRGRVWPQEDAGPVVPDLWIQRGILLLLAGVSLVGATAGVGFGSREVPTLRSGVPLVLLLDVSRSMAVDDVPWTRLGAARLAARRIGARIPDASLGLTVFASQAHRLLPPNPDRELLFSYLESLGPEMVTRQGTSLLAVMEDARHLASDSDRGRTPVFLLMTDGEDTSDPRELDAAARAIREVGGRLAAISFGTQEGGPVRLPSGAPGLAAGSVGEALSGAGTFLVSRADPDLLGRLAREGGGKSAWAGNPGEMEELLDWLVKALGQEKTETFTREGIDRWVPLVAVGLLALLVETSMPARLARPRREARS